MTAPAARRSTFAALRGHDYRVYWLGLVCYVLGQRAEYMTLAWVTWEVSRDPMWLGYLGLAQGVPLVLFQLFGGVLADRVDRRRLLLVTQALIALTLTIAFALTASRWLRAEVILVLGALSGAFRAFDEPSRMSLVPQLVERDQLPNAIALGAIPWQAGRMVGPSITGIVIAAFGGAVGFGMAAVASYAALALYSRMRLRPSPPPGAGGRVLAQFVEGLVFVGGNRIFASLIWLALFNSLFAMSYLTLLPIFADAYFRAGSAGYGLLNAAHGVGALLATLAIATLASLVVRRGLALLLGAVALGIALVAFSRAPGMEVALPALVAVGFFNTFHLMQISTYLQQHVPDRLRGRVMSLYALCWNLIPLGGLLAGALAAVAGARFAVMVGGIAVAFNAALMLGSRRLRAIA